MKRSKAIDMRFHWIRDRVRQNQFYLVYIPTKENIADYLTKNLPKELHDRFIFYLVRDTINAMSDRATTVITTRIYKGSEPLQTGRDSKRGCDEVNFSSIG
jgi:hypothetical protein